MKFKTQHIDLPCTGTRNSHLGHTDNFETWRSSCSYPHGAWPLMGLPKPLLRGIARLSWLKESWRIEALRELCALETEREFVRTKEPVVSIWGRAWRKVYRPIDRRMRAVLDRLSAI